MSVFVSIFASDNQVAGYEIAIKSFYSLQLQLHLFCSLLHPLYLVVIPLKTPCIRLLMMRTGAFPALPAESGRSRANREKMDAPVSSCLHYLTHTLRNKLQQGRKRTRMRRGTSRAVLRARKFITPRRPQRGLWLAGSELFH